MSGIDDQKAEIKLVMISNQLCAKRSRVYQNLIDYNSSLGFGSQSFAYSTWVGGGGLYTTWFLKIFAWEKVED
jgi:hypothetical protein